MRRLCPVSHQGRGKGKASERAPSDAGCNTKYKIQFRDPATNDPLRWVLSMHITHHTASSLPSGVERVGVAVLRLHKIPFSYAHIMYSCIYTHDICIDVTTSHIMLEKKTKYIRTQQGRACRRSCFPASSMGPSTATSRYLPIQIQTTVTEHT
jgi:hypothetical protein